MGPSPAPSLPQTRGSLCRRSPHTLRGHSHDSIATEPGKGAPARTEDTPSGGLRARGEPHHCRPQTAAMNEQRPPPPPSSDRITKVPVGSPSLPRPGERSPGFLSPPPPTLPRRAPLLKGRLSFLTGSPLTWAAARAPKQQGGGESEQGEQQQL